MSELKINRIDRGDSQKTLSDKINQNFDSIISYFGGPSGVSGITGKIGPAGASGDRGEIGLRGPRGSSWFIQPDPPGTGEGSSLVGDYWLSVADSNRIYKLNSNRVWVDENLRLKSGEQFSRISPNTLGKKNIIVQSTVNPSLNTLVLRSKPDDPNSLNPQYSRVVVETNPGATSPFDQSEQPLIEFYKNNGATGATAYYDISPRFRWSYPANDYDMVLDVPHGGMDFDFSGNINLSSNSSGVLLESYKSGVSVNSGEVSITSGGDLILEDLDATKKSVRISSSNFSIGLDVDRDRSEIIGPVQVSRTSAGSNYPSLTILNSSEIGGDLISLDVDTTTGSGYIWRSEVDGQNLIRLEGSGDFRTLRRMDRVMSITKNTPANPGTYGGTSISWFGLFEPYSSSQTPGGTGRITWLGERMVVISTTSTANLGIYINPSVMLSNGIIEANECFSVTVTTSNISKKFKAVGVGTYNQGNAHPLPTDTEEWDLLPVEASSVDFHLVVNPGGTSGGGYKLYYDAYGITGGIQSGVLF